MLPLEDFLTDQALLLLEQKEGIYQCMEADFRDWLTGFLFRFEEVRRSEYPDFFANTQISPNLPFGYDTLEWKFRQQSLKIMKNELKGLAHARILEVGSWNGWLTHHLAAWGHEVLATDYFLDEQDGLQSRKHYPETWTPLQMDLSKPTIFKPAVFDVIVVNHALQFMPDPLPYVRQLKALLKPGAKMVLLGMSLYKSPDKKAHAVAQSRQHYKDKYAFDMRIHPSKNYLDFKDKKALEGEGFVFRQYPKMPLRNLMAKILKYKPVYCYGVCGN